MAELRSGISGVTWPAIPGPGTAQIMALLYQLEHSQWDSPEIIAARQNDQLSHLLAHALSTVPYYRQHLARGGDDPRALVENWLELPILSRSDVQQAGSQLHSLKIPKSHAAVHAVQASGSTGQPLQVLMTGTSQLLQLALILREHLWHGRDPGGKLVTIRPDREVDAVDGVQLQSWGRPVDLLFKTGPSAMLHSSAGIDHQIDWLQTQQSTYLLSLPSNLETLARECSGCESAFAGLRAIRCYGEIVTPELRSLLHEIWRVPVVDVYSAQEVGAIALQCPEHDHYHLQSESLRVEILDDAGQPCAPGDIGRVVITTLHNFAMPLIRYEIMDHAEVGEPCPCGRGLPVVRRILGRTRNRATTPDGRRFWPSFPAEIWMNIAPIHQLQLVQNTHEAITVNYAMERELNETEQAAFTQALQKSLGYAYTLGFRRTDGAIHCVNGKHENFISELQAPEVLRD